MLLVTPPAIPLDTTDAARSALLALPVFGSIALLALVLAYWTWAWLAPYPEPRTPSTAQPGMHTSGKAALALFGSVQANHAGIAPTGIAAKLLGVVAASGGQAGFALLKIDTKPAIAVREGAEIAPGVRLAEIQADHVVLERNGVRETLAWPKPATATAPRAAR